jgi:translation initiation factor 2 alpha subunit (eIF-2alpha)
MNKAKVGLTVDPLLLEQAKKMGVNLSQLLERAITSFVSDSPDPDAQKIEEMRKEVKQNKGEIQRLIEINERLSAEIVSAEAKHDIQDKEDMKRKIEYYDSMRAAGWLEEAAKKVHGDYDGKN